METTQNDLESKIGLPVRYHARIFPVKKKNLALVPEKARGVLSSDEIFHAFFSPGAPKWTKLANMLLIKLIFVDQPVIFFFLFFPAMLTLMYGPLSLSLIVFFATLVGFAFVYRRYERNAAHFILAMGLQKATSQESKDALSKWLTSQGLSLHPRPWWRPLIF